MAADRAGSPADVDAPAVNPQWGGRFRTEPAESMRRINASIGFDRKLWRQDIEGSLAHAEMLHAAGLISAADEQAIRNGLAAIAAEIEAGTFAFDEALEDVHMNIEARLTERIGDAGRRLHTARSRNDQVATDFRMWVRDAIDALDTDLGELIAVLARRADEHHGAVMPGFTHLQVAQPVTLGHHLLAYVEMFHRDRERLSDCRRRLNECPLGAAALAGTGFPIDRRMTAARLGFDRPTRNSLDTVSDRDFALEYLSALAILSVHFSRLAEELVLWSSPMFGFVLLPEQFTSGSSIMPQKRNADAAELVRAKSGRILGALIALLATLKGLPLAYSKDMQDDKPAVFDATETMQLCFPVMTGMMDGARFHLDTMREAAAKGFSTATDLADWLVRELQLPFRNAHHVSGRLVRLAEERGVRLDQLDLADMQAVEPAITAAVFDVLGVEHSVSSRRSEGGTAPELVRREARRWLSGRREEDGS